ncbi:MAG: hypothetical protein ACFFDW_17010, partial [Candidatus Thorarchaeota archaeon]
LYPLFLGIFELTNSFNQATSSMANFGQSESPMLYPDSSSRNQITATNDTEQLKVDLLSSIEGLDNAQAALDIVLTNIETKDISAIFADVGVAFDGLDLEKFPVKVADIITQMEDRLMEYEGELAGLIDFIEYTSLSLGPTKDLLWISYYNIVGNDFIKKYDFVSAYEAYFNASEIIDSMDIIPDFTPNPALADVFAVQLTDGFSTLLQDMFNMMDPIIDEEMFFAQTYSEISTMMGIFASDSNNITEIDYTTPIVDISYSATNTRDIGLIAEDKVISFRNNVTINKYGDSYQSIGQDIVGIFTEDFKPEEFGEYTYQISETMRYFWQGCKSYQMEYYDFARDNLTNAYDIIQNNIIAFIVPDDFPDYYETYLYAWGNAITLVSNTMTNIYDKYLGSTDIKNALDNLQTSIAIVV